MAFRSVAKENGYDFRLLDEVIRINEEQRARFLRKVRSALWTLRGKRLGVLGLAFKGGTDDIRESPAIMLIQSFLQEGCRVVAYDPASGKELWRHKGVESNAIPSPVANQQMVFVSAGFPAKIVMAIRLGASGDLTDSSVWQYAKGTAYVPSPILYGDYLYLTTDRGILTCLDARTGEVKYEGGRIPIPATFTASPVAVSSTPGIVRAASLNVVNPTSSRSSPISCPSSTFTKPWKS